MKKISSLAHTQLAQKMDPDSLDFETTKDIQGLTEFVGQSRAFKAIELGIGLNSKGYNLYAMGPSGVGKLSMVRTILETKAKEQPAPFDYCYIYNFDDPQKPIALQLPAGKGCELRDDMQALIEDLSISIPVIFESDEYRTRMQKISDETTKEQQNMLTHISDEAKKSELSILSSAEGFTILPVNKKGESLTTEQFTRLPKKERDEKEALITQFSQRLANLLKQIPFLHKERRRKEKEAKREFTLMAVDHFIEEIKKKYAQFPLVINYLSAVERDVILNVKDFLKRDESPPLPLSADSKTEFSRYLVNVVIDNCERSAAPVIYEENPSYLNITGRMEHIAQFGTLITDFSLIRPGALHKANGGYLIIDALKLLHEPFAWEGLKRALYASQIKIELPEHIQGLLSTASLDPTPIPLALKVVLLGDRTTYYLLCQFDPDFDELFKVAADFEEDIERNSETQKQYAQLIANLAHKAQTLPLHRSAVAAILDHSTRLAQDQQKLSTHLRAIKDLIIEANYFATQHTGQVVHLEDVQAAIAAAIARQDRVRQNFYESIQRNFVLIQTTGETIGQINGLTVIELGHFSFGHPTRITAIVHPGSGHIIDIEREVELSGPIHAKGVLILTGFLVGRYVTDASFSLSASLVFEQTYGTVEGDSASAAELYCLLSAIAQIPLKQNLAITGSINQYGDIQAIGSVNEKIEGFFDICHMRGLTGDQGVIIPAINMQNLMLKDEVIAAVKAKKFHIYPVTTIDDALILLTDIPAGERGKNGKFPRGTVNYLVEKNLEKFAKKMQHPPKKRHNQKKRSPSL
ncbi:MAG TPA: ATP-binding protein [Gammaproteobacteria bacterium]|nr:ATP-binding protein [Gammaproteobacteria bacterium]